MIRYRFQRLALIGSAGYSRAELPLDASVSLVAPNNTGKTSLINALQFLLIVDRGQMDFGAHDFETSRRFYFPTNSAYILLEVALPNGSVVLGCVGKGVGNDYQYFAYQGTLEIDDFRLPDGSVVAQPQLAAHMAGMGRLLVHYSAREFTEAIFGGRRRGGDGEPEITLFRLDHPSQAEAYRKVLTRTLRLDRLRSSEVKNYLLTIFRRELPDSNIDFKAEWDKAFADVNADRAQYDAAMRCKGTIERMESLHLQRLQLRGKFIWLRPQIDSLLVQWQRFFEEQESAINNQIGDVERELAETIGRIESLSRKDGEHEREQAELSLLLARHNELESQFSLVASRHDLEVAVVVAQERLDEQTARVQSASGRSPDRISDEIHRVRRDQAELRRTRETLEDNLYLRLQTSLSTPVFDVLVRALSRDVLTVGRDGLLEQSDALSDRLAANDGRLLLPGLSVDTRELPIQHVQPTDDLLVAQLEDCDVRLQRLLIEQDTARDIEAARLRKIELQRDLERESRRLALFDEYLQLVASKSDRDSRMDELVSAREMVARSIAAIRSGDSRLRSEERDLQAQLQRLRDDHEVICIRRGQRRDDGEAFLALEDRPHVPWVGTRPHDLGGLRLLLDAYVQDCDQLLRLEQQIDILRTQLHVAGLTKFQFQSGSEDEVRRIIDFAEQLPQEALALERKARVAVVNVTASLRVLRDGLLTFQSRMRDFNKLVNRRQLSDLAVFRIDPVEESELVDAVNALIRTAEQVDSGETFSLFDHGTVLNDETLNRAKALLIRVGEEKGCLRVEHLFRLQFVVGKQGRREEAFSDIDSAASNGTVLMAKLVTGLALLHLMQDRRHQVQAICYLDEASALDPRNQRHLIDTAAEFGFALIFASPTPLITSRYCVPISSHGGENQIGRRSWQTIEPLETLA